MASIQDVHLEIVENKGAAAALVTYRLVGSTSDVQQRSSYRELVEPVGVDEQLGEDRLNDPIPNAFFEAVATFRVRSLNRSRLFALSSRDLDEDEGVEQILPIPFQDEIRAEVTLILVPPPPVREKSNQVDRQVFFTPLPA